MKKASYILLAMMLIIAVFVSCKAEVIDDSDYLVNVMFSSENNSKGLTWSRDFAPENYYWSYDASKADNGPRTGTATKAKVGGENGQGLKHDVGPFSIGTWDFTLYGYRDPGRNELVYEGAVQTPLAKDNNSSVKVHVSSKDEKAGTIRVSKDIRLTDGTNTTYAPTHFSIKNAKDSSPAVDINNSSLQNLKFNTTEDMSYTVESGSYVVTIEMKEGSTVYSSSQIYINVYDYQTTVVGGSLDDVKVSTRFEASDGTIVGTSNETAINTEGPTTLTTPEGVTPVKSGKTTVVFPQGALGTAKKATLKVIASPTSVSSKSEFCIEGSSPLAGIDLSVFVGGNAVTNFASPVTVTTYVAKDLTSKTISNASDAASEGLKVIYNGSGDQPTITSYEPTTGMLVFTTSHFSQYYVTSSRIVAVNVDANVAYTSLKGAVDAVTDSGYITLLQDVKDGDGILIPEGNRSITVDFNGKTYTITKGFTTDMSFGPNKARHCGFSLGKGNSVVLKNGTIKPGKADKVLVQSYCNLTLKDINLDCSETRTTSALSCSYGTTRVIGSTEIYNEFSNYNNTSVVIHNLFSAEYKEGVSVEFGTSEEPFKGKVNSCILFESDNINEYDGTSKYNHSLIVKGGDFSSAQFCFFRVGSESVFKMDGSFNTHSVSKFPTIDSGTNNLDFSKVVVQNITTDAVYEELPRAMNDSCSEFENELELIKKECVLKYSISQPNGKTIILDLNGCEIKSDTALKSSTGMFAVGSKGKLIIRDNSADKGSIDSSNNSNVPCCIFVDSRGGLEIESGITIKAAQGMKAATGCSSETITDGYTYPSN